MTAKFHSKSIANLLGVGMVALAVPLHAQNGGRPVPPPVAPGGSSAAQPAAPAPPASWVPAPAKVAPSGPAPAAAAGVQVPPGYVIGSEDILTILYWKDKDMSTEVAVRPDGKISLPLLNEIDAAGLTPEQLRHRLTEESKRYLEDPNVTVVVKQINSRRVFVTGEIGKQGPYPLSRAYHGAAAHLAGGRPQRIRGQQEYPDHPHTRMASQ